MQKVAAALLVMLGAAPAVAGPRALHVMELVADMPATPPPLKFPPPPPGPPPQLAKLSTQLVGAWTCKGSYRDADGIAHALAGKTTIALRLDGAWLEIAATTRIGDATTRTIEYRSFDVVAKQWTRVVLGSDARHAIQTSTGDDGGTWTWTGGGATDAQRFGKNEIATWRDANGDKTYETICRR